MSRQLSAYNLHVAKVMRDLRPKTTAERRAAFSHAAATWSGRASRSNPSPSIRRPDDTTLMLLVAGVAALFLLPKLMPGLLSGGLKDTGTPPPDNTGPRPLEPQYPMLRG